MKRYQVFVSSTFRDLKEYRQAVIKALLQMDAIPVGMELFPSTDDDAWSLIQRVIDSSDYHLVIIGGKYGSMDKDGIGFTEKEYDYAADKGKPIIAFLHEDPEILARENTEVDTEIWRKLDKFRTKARQRHCRFWKSSEELTIAVLTSFYQLTQQKPALGWVRGDQAKTVEDVETLHQLKTRVAQLESDKNRLSEELRLRESAAPETEKPTIATEFEPFARRFKAEWDSEFELAEKSWDEGRRILSDAKDQILEYVVELDEDKHFWLTTTLRELIKETNAALRSHQPSLEKKSWDQGNTIAYQIESLRRSILNEKWS